MCSVVTEDFRERLRRLDRDRSDAADRHEQLIVYGDVGPKSIGGATGAMISSRLPNGSAVHVRDGQYPTRDVTRGPIRRSGAEFVDRSNCWPVDLDVRGEMLNDGIGRRGLLKVYRALTGDRPTSIRMLDAAPRREQWPP